MGLNYIMEADEMLTEEQVCAALEKAEWQGILKEVSKVSAHLEGYSFSYSRFASSRPVICEDNRGISFDVFSKANIKKYGSVSEKPIEQFLSFLVQLSPSHFLVSFQYESLQYWRNENGLQKA